MFDAAVRAFGPIIDAADHETVQPPDDLDDDAYRSALSLQMAALLAVDARARRAAVPNDPGKLSEYVLDREFHHWARLKDEPPDQPAGRDDGSPQRGRDHDRAPAY